MGLEKSRIEIFEKTVEHHLYIPLLLQNIRLEVSPLHVVMITILRLRIDLNCLFVGAKLRMDFPS